MYHSIHIIQSSLRGIVGEIEINIVNCSKVLSFYRIHILITKKIILFIIFRGFVQCLKLSPNLRKKTKEIKSATMAKDNKKVLKLEIKKLESIMAMVREPDDIIDEAENEEEK